MGSKAEAPPQPARGGSVRRSTLASIGEPGAPSSSVGHDYARTQLQGYAATIPAGKSVPYVFRSKQTSEPEPS